GVGADTRHTGSNAAEMGTPPLAFAWSAALATQALNPVAYEAGRVFASARYSGSPKYMWALNATTGATPWSYNFGNVNNVGQPTVSNGRIFIGQNNQTPGTFLWSFNAATGALNWASPVGAQWEFYWSPIVVGNSVYMNGGYYG